MRIALISYFLLSGAAALLAPSAVVRPTVARRPLGRRLAEADSSEAMLAEAAALRAEADALGAAAAPAVTAEGEAAEATRKAVEGRAKITAALEAATKARDKEQLKIALAAAEAAGGFSGKSDVIKKAVVAFNELSELSDTMRSRLVKEAKSQGGDPLSDDYNPGNAYLGIFALITVLVIAGGKDILY